MLNKNLIHIKDGKWIDPSKITTIEPVGEGINVGAWGCFLYFDKMTVDEFMQIASVEKEIDF